MLQIKNRNHYNLNSPERESCYVDENVFDEMFDDMISEHLYELENSLSFIDIDKLRDEELIKMSQFKENYNGILSHDGSIKVAKSEVFGKILNIQGNDVLLRSRLKSYHAEIHKDLIGLMDFVEVGDLGYVKWRNGKCWLVGFKKSKKPKKSTSKNEWQNFFGDEKL